MWPKFTFSFLITAAVTTILGAIVTATTAATLAEPEALVAVLHNFTSQGLCHCGQQGYSLAVDEGATGRCLSLPQDFQPLTVDTVGDWNVFVFDTTDCSDKGGWLIPHTAGNPEVCNYNFGNVRSYAVLGPNQTNFNVGGRRGKIDQFCSKEK
ncbi:hypothetical protein F5Y12DRAFT_452537 [Xylaria sp. FL1777]|nr:hypothetical protein F5Y12DRAFT_452537 [Xylaria sp. FL1777]